MLENEQIYRKKATISIHKPGFPRDFFWDFNYYGIDWDSNSAIVISVCWNGASFRNGKSFLRFYGTTELVEALKDILTF